MFFDDTLLDLVARGFILAIMGMIWVVLLIRINGLRSLSKMTNFDFIMTVALGSLLASAAGASVPVSSTGANVRSTPCSRAR